MLTANVNDIASLERAYAQDAFEQDAARNARGESSVRYGVNILSEAAADGSFKLLRGSQQVAEKDPEGDSIFLAPSWRSAARVSTDGSARDGGLAPLSSEEENAALAEDYRRFLQRLCEVAKSADFKPPIGFGDDRIKGFRGG
jgi:hypothetical protein